MTRASHLAIPLFLLLAAGCLQGVDHQAPFELAQKAVDQAARRVLVLDHDADGGHRRGALHQGAYNMELVGYSNGIDDSGDPNRLPGRAVFNELAIHDQYAYLSRSSADGSFGGFSVLDIADPAHPKFMGRFVGQGGSDIEINEEGTLAFFGTQRNTVEQVATGTEATQDPSSALARGIYAVDITDPTAPVLDTFMPLPPNGPHTFTYFRHPNGNDYLLVTTYDLVTDPVTGAITGAAPGTQRLVAYLIQANPAAGTVPGLPHYGLAPVAQYQISAPPGTHQLVFPHDATVEVHPGTGRVVITVAYWDLGVRFLDFTHPPQPGTDTSQLPTLPEVGAFSDFSPSEFNNIHLAKSFLEPLHDANGTVHVTVAEPEIISADHETGQLTFLDTTDPTAPAKISWWTLPAQEPTLGVTDLDFSPHNFDTWDGKVALAHYHAGVWIVDLSTPENLAHPKEVGFYMTAKPRADMPALQPDTWSVRVHDGLIYASDESTGLYVLRYTGP